MYEKQFCPSITTQLVSHSLLSLNTETAINLNVSEISSTPEIFGDMSDDEDYDMTLSTLSSTSSMTNFSSVTVNTHRQESIYVVLNLHVEMNVSRLIHKLQGCANGISLGETDQCKFHGRDANCTTGY